MPRRQPLPHLWLMTDERIGDALLCTVAQMPRGSGVIFRHYATPAKERRRLDERVRAIARRRRLVLVLAGSPREATGWRADGAHGRSRHIGTARPLIRTYPAHDPVDVRLGSSADLVLLSPVFATRSHPGAAALGPIRFGLMAQRARTLIIALGGMDARGLARLRALGAYGWAGIDALTRNESKFPLRI